RAGDRQGRDGPRPPRPVRTARRGVCAQAPRRRPAREAPPTPPRGGSPTCRRRGATAPRPAPRTRCGDRRVGRNESPAPSPASLMARTGHVKMMARRGEAARRLGRDDLPVHSRYVDGLTIRPLRNGDTDTVAALFTRLGLRSRERRFWRAKRPLSDAELAALARVDGDHHVLVGYLDGDPQPIGVARLVRVGAAAEVAFEVADAYQRRGLGSILA